MASACHLCASGAKRILGRHVRESRERSLEDLGACGAPEEATPPPAGKREQSFEERYARWCDSAQAMGKPVQGPPPLFRRSWTETEREPGSDDGDEGTEVA